MNNLPLVSDRYYSSMPLAIVKKFNKYYKENAHMYKRHSKWWINKETTEQEEMDYMIKANEYMMKKCKHERWYMNHGFNPNLVTTQYFSYIERDEDMLIIPIYQKGLYGKLSLWRIAFWDLRDNQYWGFAAGKFKEIGIIMRPAGNVKYMYSSGYDGFYTHKHKIQYPESINILKSLDRFKYLPIDKFEYINYFKLLSASDKMIYSYELLLKFGAAKTASELLINRSDFTREQFQQYKDLLLRNGSLNYELNVKPKLAEYKQKRKAKRMSLAKANQVLHDIGKQVFEYGEFLLITPEDFEDFKKESEELNHCVGTSRNYLMQMVTGQNIIMFLRRKEEPEVPFFTIEIKNDEVLQVRTKSNDTDPLITDMVKEWYQLNSNDLHKRIQIQ